MLTNHHIVMDGWSLPILLREMFASYYGQRLPAAGPLSPVCDLAGRSRSVTAPAPPGVRCWPVSTPPPWSARRAGWGRAARGGVVPGARADHRAVGELARAWHTTVNIVLQGAYAQLLCAADRSALMSPSAPRSQGARPRCPAPSRWWGC